jgi:hypothetical protein
MLLFVGPASGSAQTTVGFTATYSPFNPWIGQCWDSAGIAGREPAASGSYPVFIYLKATGGIHDGDEAMLFVDEMAKRGFVAASVDYDSLFGVVPEALDAKSRCIFGERVTSAVSALCSRSRADCAMGIVVSGFSQGAYVAARAHNHDARVRAAYVLGLGDGVMADDHLAILRPRPSGTRSLPGRRMRIVNGQGWSEQAGERDSMRLQLNTLTGSGCLPAQTSCLRRSGSGWYVVQHSQVDDGLADHCYFHGGGGCSWTPRFDATWLPPNRAPWSLAPNLDWLAAQVGKPPTRPAAVKGLKGTYFDDAEMRTWALTRVDASVDFDWGWGSPDTAIAGDSFSVRWTGDVRPRTSETYTFYTHADDGVRLWVDGRLLVDRWTDGQTEESGSILLTAGRRYRITLEYYEAYWGATARLLWSTPTVSKRVIPQSALFPVSLP